MIHAIPPVAFFCPERRQTLERESEDLWSEYRRQSRISAFILAAAVAFYVVGQILAAYDAPLFLSWSFVVGAALLGGISVAIDAVRNGQSPAWGLLSFFGFAALRLLPNHALQRYDTVQEELSGQPSRKSLDYELDTAALIPIWGVYRVLRLGRPLREKGFGSPTPHLLFAIGSTVAVFLIEGLLIWNSRTDEIAQGKLAFVRLPAGWNDVTSSYRDNPKIEAAARSREKIAQILVFQTAKSADGTLDQYSQAVIATRRGVLGDEYKLSGPTFRTVGDRRRIEYVLQMTGNESGDLVEILTFWETSRRFWLTIATTNQPNYPKIADELRVVADGVYPTE